MRKYLRESGRVGGIGEADDNKSSLFRLAIVLIGLFSAAGLCFPDSAFAQSGSASNSTPHIMIRSSVPGAKALPEPGPNTPVPSWAQESYKIYLQMKAKAGGGTHYTRKTSWKMPDWSGL